MSISSREVIEDVRGLRVGELRVGVSDSVR